MTATLSPPDPALVARFAADLGRLAPVDSKLGLAVSGGPDSLALLLLSAAARPGRIEAATVDHALRSESAAEADAVAKICERLGVPHATLTAQWREKPETAIQERARAERYRLLASWLGERGLSALVTAHQLDDQAETLLMRLNRGAGARGLAGMRPVAPIPGSGANARLLRPLLGWRRSELRAVCDASGITPVDDPSNADERFERVRIRRGLAAVGWLDPRAMANSAANLASAEVALHWAVDREWEARVRRSAQEIVYVPSAPAEIRRRVVRRAVAELATEGQRTALRGHELDRLVAVLSAGGKATLRGVLCIGGEEWRFAPAPKRRT
ncbi:MAG TPA: tRNA lysidine(34) synthetase TilS [Sphingomicrobium sp.]|nr:tRNA lysidine(34) synthetase TilS [Sphingomicrobium sp.]